MPIPDPLTVARASAFKSSFRPPAISIPANGAALDAEDLTTPSPTLVPQWPLNPSASGPGDVACGPSPPSGTPPELESEGVGSPAMTDLGPLWRYLNDCDNPRRKTTNLQARALSHTLPALRTHEVSMSVVVQVDSIGAGRASWASTAGLCQW